MRPTAYSNLSSLSVALHKYSEIFSNANTLFSNTLLLLGVHFLKLGNNWTGANYYQPTDFTPISFLA